jgi:hypothetical protein
LDFSQYYFLTHNALVQAPHCRLICKTGKGVLEGWFGWEVNPVVLKLAEFPRESGSLFWCIHQTMPAKGYTP